MRPQQLDGNEMSFAFNMYVRRMRFSVIINNFFPSSFRFVHIENVRLCQFVSLKSSMPCIRIVNNMCAQNRLSTFGAAIFIRKRR